MSTLTINKLKQMLIIANPQATILTPITAPTYIQPVIQKGTTESVHLLSKITKCGFTVVKQKQVPITTSGIPAPISVENATSSDNTRLVIQSTLTSAADITDPTKRFLMYFPPPIPPPQNQQLGYVKYNISKEPQYSIKPCYGFRRIEP